MSDVIYRGMRIPSVDRESQPNYSRAPERKMVDDHAPTCRIPHDRIAKRDVGRKEREECGLQRDLEPTILTQCGMKLLACWLPAHWDICFEMRGECFRAPERASMKKDESTPRPEPEIAAATP